MSLWAQILAGLVAGIAAGVFLGEKAAPLKVVADGFVKLLQMTVLPYVVISILTSLGNLSYAEARRLGLRAGAVLGVLWLIGIGLAFLMPLAFPQVENASFFSTSMIEKHPPFDFVGLYIPSNPFHSLANNIVPAVVLFSVILGVALIGVEKKQALLDTLAVAGAALARATRLVVRLTPFGLFAVAAHAAGTMSVEQIARIEVYLVTYVLLACLAALWIIPGLISALTPIRFGELFASTRDALLTAFMVGDLFVVLPSLTEECRAMLRRNDLTGEHTDALPEVIVPASFNFPHCGKLLSLSFIAFAGWFSDSPVDAAQLPALAATGFLTFFGSLNAAVPFLLDMFRIPADTFQVFLATSVINARFGTLLAAVHTVAVAVLGSAAVTGALRFSLFRITRFLVVTAVLLAAVLGGVRLAFTRSLSRSFHGSEIVRGMRPLYPQPDAPLLDLPPSAPPAASQMSVVQSIRQRGKLRVCVIPGRIPFAYPDASGRLIGLDIEMAHRLASDMRVGLEFYKVELESMSAALDTGQCDLCMSGIPVTPLRMLNQVFSWPYMDETLGFVVKDHLRSLYTSWDGIRALGPVEIAVPDIPYYVEAIRRRLPQARLRLFDASQYEQVLKQDVDVFACPAERGSVISMLYPRYSIVVPEPGLIKVPLAYPVARRDSEWRHYVDVWIDLKKKDGTIEALQGHWIYGRTAEVRAPRWSVIRNVLHWVD